MLSYILYGDTMSEIRAINLGWETIKVHEAYFKGQDAKINEKINTLQDFNALLRELAKFTSTLNAGKNNGKLDFSDNAHPMHPTIEKIYLKYPELFTGYESKLYTDWHTKRIENVIFGADPIVKQLTSEVSQEM